MYATVNTNTKKELKERVAKGEKIGIFQPGPFGGNEPQNGRVCLEGPHYPKPHKWYATAVVKDGLIVSVK